MLDLTFFVWYSQRVYKIRCYIFMIHSPHSSNNCGVCVHRKCKQKYVQRKMCLIYAYNVIFFTYMVYTHNMAYMCITFLAFCLSFCFLFYRVISFVDFERRLLINWQMTQFVNRRCEQFFSKYIFAKPEHSPVHNSQYSYKHIHMHEIPEYKVYYHTFLYLHRPVCQPCLCEQLRQCGTCHTQF